MRPSSGAAVTASGKACVSHEKYLGQSRVHVTRQGEAVQVAVQLPEDMNGIGIRYASLDLTVDVPAGLPVVVTDSSGDVQVSGVQGTVKVPQ